MKNSNGEGSIYFDESRQRWVAAISVNGKRSTKRFKLKSDAEAWLALQRSNVLNNNYIDNKNITVGEWLLEWLANYKKDSLRPKTYLRYKQLMAHTDAISGIKLQALDTFTLQKYFNALEGSLANKHKVKKVLGAALAKAVAVRLIYFNPMDAVELPKEIKQEVETFTDEETKAILEYVRTNTYYRKYYSFVVLAFATGMRLGELLALLHSDIKGNLISITKSLQEVNGELQVCPPKTQRSLRTIAVEPQYINLLGHGEGYIFATRDGGPIRPTNMERTWKAILEGAGVPHKKFHTARHTFCSNQVAQGMPLPDLAKYVGHSKSSFTLDVYTHSVATTLLPLNNGLLLPLAK